MPTLGAGNEALLREYPHKIKEYLAVLQPATILACQLNGAPSGDPVISITYDNVTEGAFGDVIAGQTLLVGSTAGARDKGSCRVRKAAIAATLYIAEDSAIDWEDDDYLTVVENWEFWVKYPRIVVAGDSITFYKDWEVAYSDQHSNWRPVAVMGGADCQIIDVDSGLATCEFIGEHSYPVAPGATISSYAWVFPSGTPADANTAGTDVAPHEVTWDTAGTYWVTLTVTDSNGKTHTGRRPVFIFDRSGANAPYTQFKMGSRSGDLNQHGHTTRFEIHGDADQSEFPDRALVVYFTEDWYGSTKQSIGGNFIGREHIKFVGYIQRESTTKDPETSMVTFDAATINALMDSREGFSAWIKNKGSASNWCQATNLTADRAALSLCRYNSTILDICDVMVSGDTEYIKSQEFAAKTTLMQQLQTLYNDMFAHVACDKQGRLYFEKDPQMIPVADRAAIDVICDLTHGDWRDRLDLPRPQEPRTSFVNLGGVHYAGHPHEVEPILSKAPGDAPGYVGHTTEVNGLILAGQSDGNEKAGLILARDNNEFPDVSLPMPGLWDVFDIVPQEYVRLSLEAGDTKRGIVWTDQKLIPRRIELTIEETEAGRVPKVSIHVEKDSFGPAGVDGDYPDEPPDPPTNPSTPPPPTPPPGGYEGNAGPVVASHELDGCYWSDFMGEAWEARNTGLADTKILDLIWDPWWFTEYRSGGRDPDDVILWACGEGFVEKSVNAGSLWEDRTPTTDPPPWGDVTDPTAATVSYRQIHGDIHNIDTFYVLVEWQEPDSGNAMWRGWIAKTINDGASWTWFALGPSIVGQWMYPIGATVISGTVTDLDNILGPPNGLFMCFEGQAYIDLDYGVTLSGKDYPSGFRAKVNSPGADGPTESRYRTNVGFHHAGCPRWHIGQGGGQDPNDGTVYARDGVNFPSGQFSDGPKLRVWQWGYNCSGTYGYIDYFRMDTRNTSGAFPDEIRPLAMDLDTEDGSRLYVTVWRDDTLYLQNRSTTGAINEETSFGAATEGEVAAKTYFIVPRCPHVFGGAGFGAHVWAFGRWNDGGVKHLAKSEDSGATFADKGTVSWDVNHRVGALDVFFDGDTLYAFVNHATTPRLWQSLDQAVSWTNLNSLPFSVEFEAQFRCNWAADEFCIASNAAGAMMAAWLESPYSGSWNDGTGTPSLPTASGAISAIIWVG